MYSITLLIKAYVNIFKLYESEQKNSVADLRGLGLNEVEKTLKLRIKSTSFGIDVQ